jgi:hypothetical protein
LLTLKSGRSKPNQKQQAEPKSVEKLLIRQGKKYLQNVSHQNAKKMKMIKVGPKQGTWLNLLID